MIFDNSKIRRQDRLLSEEMSMNLLKKGEYCVLSMVDENNQPYAVPLNFVFDAEKEAVYVHCAPEGRKLRAIDKNENVVMIVVGHTKVLSAKFTTEYESVVATGKAWHNLPEDERKHALKLFLEKYSPNDMETGLRYAEKSFFRTEIIKIELEKVSGKSKQVANSIKKI